MTVIGSVSALAVALSSLVVPPGVQIILVESPEPPPDQMFQTFNALCEFASSKVDYYEPDGTVVWRVDQMIYRGATVETQCLMFWLSRSALAMTTHLFLPRCRSP
jgi:hypothetical protein